MVLGLSVPAQAWQVAKRNWHPQAAIDGLERHVKSSVGRGGVQEKGGN